MQSAKLKKPKQPSPEGVQKKAYAKKLSRKKISIVLAAIILVVAGAAVYYIATQTSLFQRSGVAVPSGWKAYSSKTYGVSFIMPEKWQVKETEPQAINTGPTAAGGSIAVINPEDFSGGYSIGIFKGTVDNVITQQLVNNGIEKAGYTSAKESVKWRDYDARKLTLTTSENGADGKKSSFTMLYVQVSDYVFLLPDKYETSASRKNTKITKEDYTKFADSIRIDKSIVEEQARIAAKPTDIPKAKDINLGEVTVPAGWKKYESSVYGISFVIPNAWEVKEQIDPSEGAALGLTIGSSSNFSDSAVMVVAKTNLDEFINQSGYASGTGANGATSSKVEKLKWQGKEARRVKLTASQDKNATSQSALFVGIGNHTYIIPDPTTNLSGVASGKFDTKEYKMFAESVRIKE